MVGCLLYVRFKTPSPITSSNSFTGSLYLLDISFLPPVSFTCYIFLFVQLSCSLSPFISLLHPQVYVFFLCLFLSLLKLYALLWHNPNCLWTVSVTQLQYGPANFAEARPSLTLRTSRVMHLLLPKIWRQRDVITRPYDLGCCTKCAIHSPV